MRTRRPIWTLVITAAANYWSLALTYIWGGGLCVCRCSVSSHTVHLVTPPQCRAASSGFKVNPETLRGPCSNFRLEADNEIYFPRSQRRRIFPRPLCLCLCLHLAVHVLVRSFVCARARFTLCMVILWADFCRLACYLNGLWRCSLWVWLPLRHQRNSLKPVVSPFTQPHRVTRVRGREGEEKCFLYSEGRLGIQGMGSYLGYCLS